MQDYDYEAISATKWTFGNSVLACIIIPVFIVFPFWAVYFMYRNWKSLNMAKTRGRYGELYAGFNTKDGYWMLFYWFIDYVRKFLLAISVVVYQDQLWLQLLVLTMSSIFIIIANGHIKAKTSKFDQRMEAFNEVKLLLLMYHMLCFTELGPDPETKYTIGYSCSATLILGTAVNMIMMIVTPIKSLILYCKICKHKRRARKSLKVKGKRPDAKNFQLRRLKL